MGLHGIGGKTFNNKLSFQTHIHATAHRGHTGTSDGCSNARFPVGTRGLPTWPEGPAAPQSLYHSLSAPRAPNPGEPASHTRLLFFLAFPICSEDKASWPYLQSIFRIQALPHGPHNWSPCFCLTPPSRAAGDGSST